MKDIDEVRRDNLRKLEQEYRSAAAAAAVVGMSPSQFNNLRDGAKDSKTGKHRVMRKETAWRIEDAAGKPRGWLDTPHDAVTAAVPPRDYQAWETYNRADEDTKALVDAILAGNVAPWLDPSAINFLNMMKSTARQWRDNHRRFL